MGSDDPQSHVERLFCTLNFGHVTHILCEIFYLCVMWEVTSYFSHAYFPEQAWALLFDFTTQFHHFLRFRTHKPGEKSRLLWNVFAKRVFDGGSLEARYVTDTWTKNIKSAIAVSQTVSLLGAKQVLCPLSYRGRAAWRKWGQIRRYICWWRFNNLGLFFAQLRPNDGDSIT